MTQQFWKYCCSLKLAIILASTATFLLMGGSLLFPGNPQLFSLLDKMTLGRWLNNVANLSPVLSWWFYAFVAATLLLMINTLCCFIDWLCNITSRWRKIGEYLIHLGVVLLVLGFTWGAVGGWRHIALPCTIGELTPLPNWPGHYLAVDSFKPEFGINGSPTDMISQIRLLSGEQELLAGEVRINQPILKDGLVITPASFGQTPTGFVFSIAGQQRPLKAGDNILLTNKGGQLKVLRFLPDAQYNKNGQLLYRRDRIGSPAMELSFTSAGGQNWQGWYFLRQGPPEALRTLQLQPLRPLYSSYSSLTVNYDPGVNLSSAGGFLMALGCLLALVSYYRKRGLRDRPQI